MKPDSKFAAASRARLLLSWVLHLLLFFIFDAPVAFGVAYTPSNLPDPKMESLRSWVSDPDQFLSSREIAQLDQELNVFSQTKKAQVAVVIVREISKGKTPKEFATDLFNRWGIGEKGKDNGLLLLVVVDQRRWEFETGYGLEGDLPDILLKQIGEEFLTPAFRRRQYHFGISQALQKIHGVLSSSPVSGSELPASQPIFTSQRRGIFTGAGFSDLLAVQLDFFHWLILAAAVSLSLLIDYLMGQKPRFFVWKRSTLLSYPCYGLALYGLFCSLIYFVSISDGWQGLGLIKALAYYFLFHQVFFLLRYGRAYWQVSSERDVSRRLDKALGFFSRNRILLISSLGFWFLPLIAKLNRKARFSPHSCTHCSAQMTAKTDLVAGEAENEFLDRSQQLEQQFQGLDYDVWKCSKCSHLSLFPIKLEKEGISDCDECGQRTLLFLQSKVMKPATATHVGRGCSYSKCQACGFVQEKSYEIPRIADASPYHAGGASSSGSGFSGSSGTGWGGGRSGGGGAGGSW